MNSNEALNSLNNEDLYWQMASTGDALAQQVFYKRFATLVFLTANRFLLQEDARDVAIEVMNKVMTKPSSERLSSVQAYLYRITKNHALTWLDRLSRRGGHEENYTAQIISLQNVESEFVASLNREEDSFKLSRLYKALDELKPDQRQCLTLFFFENCSYIEAAEIMEIDIKLVKSYIQNGKIRLKNLLKHTNI
ncbi:MAG: RNA polymerase sigma factor [Saprospiraceae bacterium]